MQVLEVLAIMNGGRKSNDREGGTRSYICHPLLRGVDANSFRTAIFLFCSPLPPIINDWSLGMTVFHKGINRGSFLIGM